MRCEKTSKKTLVAIGLQLMKHSLIITKFLFVKCVKSVELSDLK